MLIARDLRIEVGPRDCANNEVVVVRRDTGEKSPMSMEGLREKLEAMLDEIQNDLLARAKKRMDDNTHDCDSYDEYKERVGDGGFYRIHWDGTNETETRLQDETKSTIRCIPLDEEAEPGSCLITGQPSAQRVIASQGY